MQQLKAGNFMIYEKNDFSNNNIGMNTEYTTGIWISSIWVYLHVHFFFTGFL